jgi:hypothetical protein
VRSTEGGVNDVLKEDAAVLAEDAAVLIAPEAAELVETAVVAVCDVATDQEMTAGEFAASLEMVMVPLASLDV